MVTGFIQSLLPLITLTASLSASYTPSATLQASTSHTSTNESRYYSVKIGDSLTSIAMTFYGDESYWTTLWNDNDWIEDPQTIKPTWQIKIRMIVPDETEPLKPELLKKHSESMTSSITLRVESSVSSQAAFQAQSMESGPLSEEQMNFLGNCESGMRAEANTGNGYYGAFQFSFATWKSMNTGYERADLAPLEVQKDAVQRLLTRSSIWTQFPGCAAKMRSAGLI